MKRNIRRGFTLVELMVVIGILGLLVGILAVAVIPKLTQAKNQLEIKQLGDIKTAFNNISINDANKRKLQQSPLKETQGRKFYDQAFKKKLLDTDIVNKIVSLNSKIGDFAADKSVADPDAKVELEEHNCSYTAPKAVELLSLMSASGKNRKVLITFNSRNWNNYESEGVIVQWTDGETAEYMAKDVAQSQYQIDNDTWESNSKDIIGNKAPFDKTYE